MTIEIKESKKASKLFDNPIISSTKLSNLEDLIKYGYDMDISQIALFSARNDIDTAMKILNTDSIEEYGYELNCLLKQVREFRRSDIKGQMIAIRTDSNGKKYTEVLAEGIFKADSDVESSDDSYDIIEDVKSDKIKSGNALNINDIIGNRNPNIDGETINSHSNINQNINERNSNIDGETINSHSNINQNINERNPNIDGETINSHSNINQNINERNSNIDGETINSHSNINQNINERNPNIDGETINSHSNINQNINERNSNIDGETINSHSNINQNINERNSNIDGEISDGHQNINGRILKPKSNNNKSRQAILKLSPNFIQVNRVNIQVPPAPALPQQRQQQSLPAQTLPQQRQQQSLPTQALPKQQPYITDNLSFDNFINPQIIIDNAKVYQSISDKRSQYNLSKTICEQCVANYNILNKDDKEAQRIKISDILRTYHTFSISDSDKFAYRKTIYPQGIPLRFECYYCKNDHLELHYYCAKRKNVVIHKLYHYFQLVRI
ncbi:hypothetical protein TVAG_054800 [Trichomonas vaginalis G3]|uniref:UBA domain-containing protein n=1 Tax=Trichomonas vaginalis (strain ATCC PRA-98 / G3) TaxID=412133 RepID=A2FHV9_TRIV3|nr:hypothetical protein TVAGG3_0833910 [Trichomonas vaginalis G3]EAX95501.1 hypothetical protein TVAG_054800 [Trichomonas vaginalis G3]KAI5498778.1 hypothetical protein TVAGG3_0833910 [Trichomonas vaginalis G3]|eukprot:XP_001308431.1 hypothetical protein [Trichomonas vaginalis G3]